MWNKAPTALLRERGVLVALVGAALLLGAAAASGPLYLASTDDAAFAAEVSTLDPASAGLRVEAQLVPEPAVVSEIEAALDAEVRGSVTALSPVQRGVRSVPIRVAEPDTGVQVRLVAEIGAPGVEVDDGGAVLPADLGRQLRLDVGDELVLERSGQRSTLTVGGMDPGPPDGEHAEIVVSARTAVEAASGVGAAVTMTWRYPLDPDEIRGSDIQAVARRLSSVTARLSSGQSEAGALLADAAGTTMRVQASSGLPEAAQRTREASRALAPAVRSLWVAAMLAGLTVVSGAGVLRMRRRRGHHRLMAVRGVGPAGQATRAVVEAAGPVFAGAALGLVGAAVLVAVAGPGGLARQALGPAAVSVLAAAALALCVITAVTGAGMTGLHTTAARSTRALGRIPWEVIPAALAVLAYQRLHVRAGGSSADGLDPVALAFPALALLSVAGLSARALAPALPRLRRRRPGATWTLLTVRRLAAAPGATVTLVVTAAIAVGLLTTAATIGSSAADTAHAKAAAAVGGNAVAPVPWSAREALVDGATVVGRTVGEVRPGPLRVDVLVIDPDTFPTAVAWDPAGLDLPALVGRLDRPSDGQVPALLAGGETRPSVLVGRGVSVPLDVVGMVEALPGMGERPLLVLGQQSLAAVLADETEGVTEVLAPLAQAEGWAGGDEATARDRLRGLGAEDARIRTVAQAADAPALRATRWTLAYLQAVAAAAGLLAIAAIGLSLAERQRAREVAYALARRMGLQRRAHLVSIATELGGLLGAALAWGVAVGLAVAAVTVPVLDPQPAQPPAPLFVVPWAMLAAALVVATAAAGFGALLVQRRADRTKVGEVLRAGE